MSPRTVLVVDDDADYRDTVRRVLGDAGYRTVAAGDGREAFALLERGPLPDLILLDLSMPGMDGWQLRAAQLANPRLAAIPVLVLTAGRIEGDVDGAEVVSKLVGLRDLVARVRALCPP